MQFLWIILPNLLSLLVSSIAGETGGDWYKSLNRSPLTPPGWVFGVVWPILYTMIGYVLANLDVSNTSKYWLYANLILNYLWIIVFNRVRNYKYSFLIILGMIMTLVGFYITNMSQENLSLVLIPYFIWLIFASFLNYYIWTEN